MDFSFYDTWSVIPRLTSCLKAQPAFKASGGNSTKVARVCRELRGVSIQIDSWADKYWMMQRLGLNTQFAEQDLADRLSPYAVNPGQAVSLDTSGVLSKHLTKSGTLDYTYSERMWYQVDRIILLLKENPETRQAFISIWDPQKDIQNLETRRVPCSIGFHFLLRGEVLDLIYYMRSLEVSTCMGYDIFTSTGLLEFMAQAVGVKPGGVTFMVGSLHIFEEETADE